MKKLLATFLLVLLFSACRKEHVADKGTELCKDGFIFWGGEPGADGLGWYFAEGRSGAEIYIISNLPQNYKADSTAVNLCITETDQLFYCFCASPRKMWAITSIRQR